MKELKSEKGDSEFSLRKDLMRQNRVFIKVSHQTDSCTSLVIAVKESDLKEYIQEYLLEN